MGCTSCKKEACGGCTPPANPGPAYAFPISSFVWTGEPVECNGITINTGDTIDQAMLSIINEVCGIGNEPSVERISGEGVDNTDPANPIINIPCDIEFNTVSACEGDTITVFDNLAFPEPELPTLEPLVTFTKTDYGTEVDQIEPGVVQITRGNSQGLFNDVSDLSYFNGAPTGTEWNSVYTDGVNYGWGDLTNLKDRVYGNWNNVHGAAAGDNLTNLETVMRTAAGKYYLIKVTQWTSGAAGGGFTWERQEVIFDEKKTITFGDTTIQDVAAGTPISTDQSITITESIVDNRRFFDLSVTPPLNYTQIVYVSKGIGSDSTGEVGNIQKPFSNIYNAQLALEATLGFGGRGLVYVMPGTYINQTIYLSVDYKINYYCCQGVVLQQALFNDDFGVTDSSVYGHAVVINTSLNIIKLQYENSRFSFVGKTLSIIGSQTSGIYSQTFLPTYLTTGKVYLNVEFEEITFNSTSIQGALIQARSGSFTNIKAKTINVASQGYFIRCRPSATQLNACQLNVTADVLNFSPSIDGADFSGCLIEVENNEASNSIVVDIKKTYFDAKTSPIYAFFSPFTMTGGVGSIEWIGDIEMKTQNAWNPLLNTFNSFSTENTTFKHTGIVTNNLIAGAPVIQANVNFALDIDLQGEYDLPTSASSVVDLNGVINLSIRNSIFKSEATTSFIKAQNGVGVRLFNSSFDTDTATEFLTDAGGVNDAYLGNVISNIAPGTFTVLNNAALFTVDSALVLPNIKA